MNKTTSEQLQSMLLSGVKINKFKFLDATNSVCLAQRILELRQMGWNIRSRAIKGKGNLREYWLDREEIDRIKGKHEQTTVIEENKPVQAYKPPLKSNEQTDLFGGISEWW